MLKMCPPPSPCEEQWAQNSFSVHRTLRSDVTNAEDFHAMLAGFRHSLFYRGADKSLARPGRTHATATEDFEFHISYLLS